MPSRKLTKRKKKNSFKANTNTSTSSSTTATKSKPHTLSDVYETEPNRSWINVRYWSGIIGHLSALLIYFFVAFQRNIMIKGPSRKLIGPLFGTTYSDKKECTSLNTFGIICIIFWSIHHLRRLFEIMVIQKFYRYASHSEITGSIIFYGSLAIFNGICNNIYVWFREQWQCPSMANIVLGIVLFVIGQFGNSYHHYLLKQIRIEYQINIDKEFKGHILPKDGMFDYVTCPHYFFEIITWFGWMFICQFSTGSMMIFGIVLATLLMKAIQVHAEYKQKFRGLYPHQRKALIPFVF